MIVLSDIVTYRPDGTVSGIMRKARETFTTPSGREQTEDVESPLPLEEWEGHLVASYAQFHVRNIALEEQISREREAFEAQARKSAAEVANLLRDRSEKISELEAELAAKSARIEELEQIHQAASPEKVEGA